MASFSLRKHSKHVSSSRNASDSLPGSPKNIALEHIDEKTKSSSFNPSEDKSYVRSKLSNSISSLGCSKDNAPNQIFEGTIDPSFRHPKRAKRHPKRALVQKIVSSGNFLEETFDGATNNASKSSESKQLSVFPLNFIESRLKGYNIEKQNADEIIQLIANRCNITLTEVLKAATDYMKRCGRLQFTNDDFNKGLFFSGLYPENLSSEAEDEKTKSKAKKRKQASKSKQLKNISDTSSCQKIYITERWLNDSDPLSADIKNLATELQDYLKVVKDIVHYTREEDGCIIAKNLQTNQNLTQLIPHLVDFFCKVIEDFDFIKVSLVFKFIDALLKNPFVYFGQDSYLNILLCAFFTFLVSDLSLSSQSITDCCCLKDTAANILAVILKRSKCQHQYFELMYLVNDVLKTVDSINVYYGALAVLNALGIPAIILIFPSFIEQFCNKELMSIYSTLDAHLIRGQIIHLYYVLVDYFLINEVRSLNLNLAHLLKSKFIFPDYLRYIKILPVLSMIEITLSKYAGEALQPVITYLLSHSTSVRKKETTSQALEGRKMCFKNYSLLLGTL